MSYKTYITKALVCGSRAHKTSDKSYLLFTREAGMLYATAQSVREERSKQRFALQEFSYVRVSLIHGKSGWRVAGAEALGNLYAHEGAREARALMRNTILLVRRVVRGEEAHPELFDDILSTLTSPDLTPYDDMYTILALRILHTLGYVTPSGEHSALLTSPRAHDGCVLLTDALRSEARALIEKALRESHL